MMLPKHAKTNYFLKTGLFDGLESFSGLEKRISALSGDKEKGDAFEVFAEGYLATQKMAMAAEVWPFEQIPTSIKKKYGLDVPRDIGVDGLLQTVDDERHAYQVKFRTGRPSLTWKGDLSTFVGLSDRTDKKLIFTNSNKIPRHLEQRDDVYLVRGTDLDRLEARELEQVCNWLRKSPKPKPRKEPRPYQTEAIEAIAQTLGGTTSKRATTVMACGTGKTLVALWVAEKLGYKKILVLVPSLALLSQTLHDWMKETSWDSLSYLCVCSDPTVMKGADNWEVRQSDLDFPVTTDGRDVTDFLTKRTGGVKIIFSTYQSAPVVAEGLPNKSGFDLGIFDEAHKTAGRAGTVFAYALDDTNLPISKRLFLTATPRHYNVLHKDEDGELKTIYSMDDEGTYGPRVYELPFSEAAKKGIICGYKVLISVVTSEEVNDELLRRGEVLIQGEEVKARQVANQLALKRATEKYPTRKIFTFHTRVVAAESFIAKGGAGLHNHLPGFHMFHVNGAMQAATRESKLREFEQVERAVMTNARCLTEGVNVPVVDMVAFMSPKKSRVDIIQATGRAMRRSDDKETGYVLIPLFLQTAKDESIADALERTDFSEIWKVLQAMSEQETELADIISEMGITKASRRATSYDDQKFREKVTILGPEVSLDKLRGAITIQCVQKLGSTWDTRYGELLVYKEEHGGCLVSRYDQHQPELGRWVGKQRSRYRTGTLSSKKIRMLNDIGFEWEPDETRWDEMYELLVEYYESHGNCRVPQKTELGNWVLVQRQFCKKPSRVALLNSIGFEWDPRSDYWQKMYHELLEYQSEHGHCYVPFNGSGGLGSWVTNQRARYKTGKLSPDRIQLLNDINFSWNTLESRWEEMFQQLVEYREMYNHCNVPADSQLGIWLSRQRALYRQGTLNPERIERLDKLGLQWVVVATYEESEDEWQEQYQQLLQFYRKHGTCAVPDTLVISSWVNRQRVLRRNGKLDADRIQLLEHLGFEWRAAGPIELEDTWQVMFRQLVEFHKEHGTCEVPYRSRLGRWVVKQRCYFRENRLPSERVRLLDNLGFIWSLSDARWDAQYRQLVAYKEIRGDCNVPANQPTQLSAWVHKQRQLYKKGQLTSDQTDLLQTLGFDWHPHETSWQNMYRQLVEYQEEHGTCAMAQTTSLGKWVTKQRQRYKKGNMPDEKVQLLEEVGLRWDVFEEIWQERYQQLVSYQESHLGSDFKDLPEEISKWVARQRYLYRKGKLSTEKIVLLEDSGISWEHPRGINDSKHARSKDESTWNRNYQLLIEYEKEHHNCLVPVSTSLGKWVSNQRRLHKQGQLGQHQEQLLCALGFVWDVKDARWRESYQQLVKYRDEHGDCNAPQSIPLGNWVSGQRTRYRKGALDPKHKELLDDIGFAWTCNRSDAQWQKTYEQLVQYMKQHGDCNVSQDYGALGCWVANMRALHKKGALSSEKVERLENIGFTWGFLDARWQEQYEKLVLYKEEHGHCDVSAKDPELGRWVVKQRTRFKDGVLDPERRRLLDELGLTWKPLDAQWDVMYQQLIDFKEENGHCLVPAKCPSNKPLGAWVASQRTAYRSGKLQEVRKTRLDELGFIWNPPRNKFGSRPVA